MKNYYLKKSAMFSVLLAVDAAGLYLLLAFSWLCRQMFVNLGLLRSENILRFHHINEYYLPLIGMSLLVFFSQSLYFSRSGFFIEYKKIIQSSLILFLFWGFYIYIFRLGAVYSRFISFLFFIFIFALFPFYRRLVKTVLFHVGIWRKQVMVIGDHFPGHLRNMINDRSLGYEPVYRRVRDMDELERVLKKVPAAMGSDLVLIFRDLEIGRMESLLKSIEFNYETIRIFSSLSLLLNYIFFVETSFPNNFFVVKRNLLKPYNRIVKRIGDLILGSFLAILFLPLFLLICLVLAVVNRGQVFFIQERVGFRGKWFKLIKFRTMHQNSQKILQDYLEKNPELKKDWERYRKFRGKDPRVSGAGRLLRRTSLDELPQIINIIRGEMSLIGPRPYLIDEIENLRNTSEILAYAKPGLTGLWQILGRNEIDFRGRISIDEFYIRNWDFWLDLFILMRTPFSMHKGH